MPFPFEPLRPNNAVLLFGLEGPDGSATVLTASDAIPFENDSITYNSPWGSEESNENTGGMIDGLPLVIGQPSKLNFRFRVKGAGSGAVYSPTVKPPHHAVFQAAGWRGVFTAGQAAAAITAGTDISVTLAAAFSAVAQSLRGMPLRLNGGGLVNRMVHVADYSAARLAVLTDKFADPLTSAVTAELLANWTYAPTSPEDAAARKVDQPRAVMWLYEDGRLLKWGGLKGTIELSGDTAKPGFCDANFEGIFLGETVAAVPKVTVAQHSAPVLSMGGGGVTPAQMVDRIELACKSWKTIGPAQLQSIDDANTDYGFSAPDIGNRAGGLSLDPLTTLNTNINRWNQIEIGARMSAVLRHGQATGNSWSMVQPCAVPVKSDPGKRGIHRTDQLELRALSAGPDATGRDGDQIIAFY